LVSALAFGIAAVIGLNIANSLEVPGMNWREGFPGIEFMMTFMYALDPSEWLGMTIISGLYFMYGAVAGCMFGLLFRGFLNRVD